MPRVAFEFTPDGITPTTQFSGSNQSAGDSSEVPTPSRFTHVPSSANAAFAIDNIVTKGFAISDVGVQADPALSDHALLKCRLTFLPE